MSVGGLRGSEGEKNTEVFQLRWQTRFTFLSRVTTCVYSTARTIIHARVPRLSLDYRPYSVSTGLYGTRVLYSSNTTRQRLPVSYSRGNQSSGPHLPLLRWNGKYDRSYFLLANHPFQIVDSLAIRGKRREREGKSLAERVQHSPAPRDWGA